MKKTSFVLIIAICMSMFCNVYARYAKVRLYAPDGRSEVVDFEEVDAQLKVGWYEYPVQTLYSADGRTEVFNKKDVPAQLTVGWYDHPVQTLYSLDGRAEVFDKKDVPAQLTVGWYTERVVIMYSSDGTKTQVVPFSQIEVYERKGWCYGKPVKMYAWSDREMIVGENRVELYKSLNWHTEPLVTMYSLSAGGFLETTEVPQDEVEAQKKVGWSTKRPTANYKLNMNTVKKEAYACLRLNVRRPSSLEIYSTNTYDVTEKENWNKGLIVTCVEIDCSSLNGFGGYTREYCYVDVTFSVYNGKYWGEMVDGIVPVPPHGLD